MARYGMLIDTTKCSECYSCRVACQHQNHLPKDEAFITLNTFEKGTFPNVSFQVLPVQCQHCDNPPCKEVCPTGATYQTEHGFVLVDQDRCIGCKYCMVACPYGARVQNHETGVVEKCKFCAEGVISALGTSGGADATSGASSNIEDIPACVNTCISSARIFGDLDDPNSTISKEIIARKAAPLRPDLGTKPKIYYVR